MNKKTVLLIDSVVNLLLGLLLLFYSPGLAMFLGVPQNETGFYPSILGGVLVGIAVGLFYEALFHTLPESGLGMVGAIAINICGSLTLGYWLVFSQLSLPIRGIIFLWGLFVVVFGISMLELVIIVKKNRKAA